MLAYTTLFFIFGYSYYITLIRPFTLEQIWTRQITIWGPEDDVGKVLFGRNNISLTVTFSPVRLYRFATGYPKA